MRLKFTHESLNDLVRLREFIVEKNPSAAEKYARKLISSIQNLIINPELGRILEEKPDVRELVAGNYIVRYSLRGDIIYILKVWHGKEYR